MNLIKVIFILIACVFIVSCNPSPESIEKAIAETQTANPPNSTFTPIPPTQTLTAMPTETPTATPSPTPNLLDLQLNLKEFLLQRSDLPANKSYVSLRSNKPQPFTNQDVGLSNVSETGRIDGWYIEYAVGHTGSWNETVQDVIALYQTTEGAQKAVSMYEVAEDGIEEINQPTIGDKSRSVVYRFPTNYSGDYQVIYEIIFSYRNCVHTISWFGWEKETLGLAKKTALILLSRLQSSHLVNP